MKVIENVDAISEITDRKGNWSITTTITKQSDFDDVKSIHEYAKKKGFMFAIRPYIAVSGAAGRHDESLEYSPEDTSSLRPFARKTARRSASL